MAQDDVQTARMGLMHVCLFAVKLLQANTLFEGMVRVLDDAGQGMPLWDLCAAAAAEKEKRGELSAANTLHPLALPKLISDMGLWK